MKLFNEVDVGCVFGTVAIPISAERDHKLILEGMNEEGSWTTDGQKYGTPNIPPLNEMNQLFVTTVRAQGGYNATRALLIAGFNTDIDKTCVSTFTVPTAPAGTGKLFLSIHYYTPWTFTIKEKNDSANDTQPVSKTWGTAAEKKALVDAFSKLASGTLTIPTRADVGRLAHAEVTRYLVGQRRAAPDAGENTVIAWRPCRRLTPQ